MAWTHVGVLALLFSLELFGCAREHVDPNATDFTLRHQAGAAGAPGLGGDSAGMAAPFIGGAGAGTTRARALVGSPRDGVRMTGLVAHWSLDGTLRDSTGHGHDARVASGADCEVAGAIGQACELTPQGHLQVDESPLPRVAASGYAADAWIRVADGELPKYVVAVGISESFAIKYYQRSVICVMKDQRGYQPIARSPQVIDEGRWHHVTCVYDALGETLTGYVDGQPGVRASVAGFGELADSVDRGMGIGCLAEPIGCSMTSPFSSITVDEIRMWSRSLSPSEVASLAEQ